MSIVVDWPLVGRAEEMQIIDGAFNGEAGYAGAIIAGPAGVGKTRLIHETISVFSQRDWVVHSIAATPSAQAIPLGAFSDWVTFVDGQPLNIVGSVIAAITASPDNAPVLVAVDDAHLLDDLSAFLLDQLVHRRLAVVIATIRTGLPTPATVASLWKESHLRRLDLEPLSRPQSKALLEAVLGDRVSVRLTERMWDLTRGNVLFLRELVRQELDADRLISSDGEWRWADAWTASPTLIDLVDLAIGSAPPSALEVLDLVALADPLDMIFLDTLADRDAIEEAERRGLITVENNSGAGVVRVAHPMYGEARRANGGSVREARLRGRIAAAMNSNQSGSARTDPVQLGLLWLESDLPRDPDIFIRGATAASLRLDLNLTRRLAEAATTADAGIEAQILHAQSLTRLGQADDAERVLDSLATSDHPTAVWAAAIMRAAILLFSRGMPEQSWAFLDQAMQTAPDMLAPSLQSFRVAQLAIGGRPAEAVVLAESLDRTTLSPLPSTILSTGLALALGDLGRQKAATEIVEAGNQLAASSPDAAFQAVGLNLVHAGSLVLAGSIRDALTIGGRLEEQWADIPRVPRTVANAVSGIALLAHGELRPACERLEVAVREAESRKDGSGLAYLLRVHYTEALARAGEYGGALESQQRMQSGRHNSYVCNEPARLLAMSWVAAAGDRITEAVNQAEMAAECARVHGQLAREVTCIQSLLQFGENPHRSRLDELADLVEGPRAGLVVRWARALAANDGNGLLEVSIDIEKMGDRVAGADAAAHAALAYERQNLRGARLTASERATRIITECGAATPATRAATTPLPLSRREREIATLVRDGLSNKQIAEALTMSVRTVEGHIYRACNKVGITTRAELACLMAGDPAP